jgi:hypothetical protein
MCATRIRRHVVRLKQLVLRAQLDSLEYKKDEERHHQREKRDRFGKREA